MVSKKVIVKSGETATFSCEYSQNHINDAKVIFKERQNSIDACNEEERFSISDDKHKNIFSVRITAVTPDDGGVMYVKLPVLCWLYVVCICICVCT